MTIYLITNKLNGKKYVGQTRQPVKARWQYHCNPAKKCFGSAVRLAIIKYGKANFTFEVLEEVGSIEETNYLEAYYIRHYQTLAPNGYNLTTGGEAHTVSDETRKKLSLAHKGKKYLGRRKPLYCVETGEYFSDAEEAANKLGIAKSHISAVCLGQRSHVQGKVLRYV